MKTAPFRGGFSRPVRTLTDVHRKQHEELKKMIALIEPGAGVTVTNRVGPHVSNRMRAYLYRQRKVQESHYVLVDERELRGKWKSWHNRRVAREELQVVAEYKTFKLYRFHPENEKAKPKVNLGRGEARPGRLKPKGKVRTPRGKTPRPHRRGPGEDMEDDRGAMPDFE